MNRLGFNAGVVDGILGPITDGAIKRMQKFLGTDQDGYVGPKTRALINNSCGEVKEEKQEKTNNNLGSGQKCLASQILTQNLKTGDRNGRYSS